MFTGLIQDLGRVREIHSSPKGARLRVASRLAESAQLGESISINGVCLTIVTKNSESFEFELSPETLARTSLGQVKVGQAVNLEAALQVTAKLGGHIVQGHVDGQGTLVEMFQEGDYRKLIVEFPENLKPYLVDKGSIAIDGISLTINRIYDSFCRFDVMIIPHTWSATHLFEIQPGAKVNLEVDILAKYVLRSMQVFREAVQ